MALSTFAGAALVGAEHIGDHFLSGERGEGERRDEFLRRARHHHLHVELFLLQAAHQFRGLVSGHATGNAECDFHCDAPRRARLLRRFSVLVLGVLRSSDAALVFEQALLQFFLGDARGLARARIIHQGPPADHQLPRAPRDHHHVGKLAFRCIS